MTRTTVREEDVGGRRTTKASCDDVYLNTKDTKDTKEKPNYLLVSFVFKPWIPLRISWI